MSSSAIIASIIVLLVALVCYAFISQTMERKRLQRQRLLSGLKQRWKDFKYMATGFPEGFLPKELNLLVHRCLVDICEQLIQLEPKTAEYPEALALFDKQFQTLKTQNTKTQRITIDNPQQVKEVRALLQGLNTFIVGQHKRGRLNAGQFSMFEKQIKQLVVQITADAYLLNAKQAEGQGKLRLAVHYYLLARKLLIKEDSSQSHASSMQQIDHAIARLEQTMATQEGTEARPERAAAAKEAPTSSEWDEFATETGDSWKKKAIYD